MPLRSRALRSVLAQANVDASFARLAGGTQNLAVLLHRDPCAAVVKVCCQRAARAEEFASRIFLFAVKPTSIEPVWTFSASSRSLTEQLVDYMPLHSPKVQQV